MTVTIDGTTGVSAVQTGAIDVADLPTGSVLQVQTQSQTGSSTNNGSSVTSYVDTGLSVSITPQSSSSTIVVFVTASMGLNVDGTYDRARFDYRCLESGDSSIIFEYRYIGQEQGNVVRQDLNGHGSYANTSTSTKTFKCQVRLANGEDTEGANMYYRWYDNSKFNITAMEIAG